MYRYTIQLNEIRKQIFSTLKKYKLKAKVLKHPFDKYIYIVETDGGTILIYPNKLANYKIRPEKVYDAKLLIKHLKSFTEDGWDFKTFEHFSHHKSFEENMRNRYKKLRSEHG